MINLLSIPAALCGFTESNIPVVISPYSQNCGSGGGGVIPGRDGNVFLLSILNLLILKIQSVSHYYFIFLNLNFFPNQYFCFLPQVAPYDYETITGIVHFQSETPEMLTIQLIVHLIVKDLCYAKVLVTREWVHFQLHFTREMVLYQLGIPNPKF